jgi:hypothetical protein
MVFKQNTGFLPATTGACQWLEWFADFAIFGGVFEPLI